VKAVLMRPQRFAAVNASASRNAPSASLF